MTFRSATLALAAAVVALPAAADHGPLEALGSVSFPTSCKPAVQPAFERAVALLHSFGYEPAREAFGRVAADDPGCAMAQWGIAMSQYHPLWAAPSPAEFATGSDAAAKAGSIGAPTEREKGYIEAITRFYADSAASDHKTRAGRYRDAMEELTRRFPDDDEAALFHALSLLGTAPPNDPTKANQKRAAEILVPRVAKLPQHPGVAHYMIHALDYPDLAAQGLDAARRYARIAPGSPHALHMPSHVFVRLGLWPESIASNRDSADAALALADRYPSASAFDALHALDYLVYAYLQGSQDAEARAALAEVAELAVAGSKQPTFAAAYSLAAAPARYALEREAWSEAAALPLSMTKSGAIDPFIDERYAYTSAITYFARAVGAAKTGDVAGAEAAVAELTARQQRLAKSPPPGVYDWAGHVEAQRMTATALLERARGNDAEALRLLTAAAEQEEKVGKNPVTPGSVLPARELLADLYLELGRPRDALAQYESSLVQAPNRLRSLQGAARAAEKAGETERARTLRNLVGAITASGEPRTPHAAAASG